MWGGNHAAPLANRANMNFFTKEVIDYRDE